MAMPVTIAVLRVFRIRPPRNDRAKECISGAWTLRYGGLDGARGSKVDRLAGPRGRRCLGRSGVALRVRLVVARQPTSQGRRKDQRRRRRGAPRTATTVAPRG